MSKEVDLALYMVFDVESIGLHGEGYAVGFVVVDETGREHGSGFFSCPPERASGTKSGREWVMANVPAFRPICPSPVAVREAFWQSWLNWKDKGAVLVADCAWPVEARFLAACVEDRRPVIRSAREWAETEREWEGPYPLHDVATMRLAAGFDPLATEPRTRDVEEPAHHPEADARQSARLWVEALAALRATGVSR